MRARGRARSKRASIAARSRRTCGDSTDWPSGSSTTGTSGGDSPPVPRYFSAIATFVSQPSLPGTENSGSSASEAGPAAAMPEMASTIQTRTTVRLCERTQRVSEDIMAATVRPAPPAENVRPDDSGSSHGCTRRPPPERSECGERGATLAEMASARAHDAGLALLAFAASVALLAVGENENGDGFGALDVLVVACASLPLVAWRVAPLAVFVVTALASSLVFAIAEPTGPPIGPTVAVYLLAVHVVAGGILGAEILFGVLVWGGAWLAGDRARLRRERMAELEERALRAEREAERERRLAAAE